MRGRLGRAITVAVALLGAGCDRPHVVPMASAEVRWDDGAYAPVQAALGTLNARPPRPGRHDVWVRVPRPKGAEAVYVTLWGHLVEARSGGKLLLDEHARFGIAALPAGDDPIEAHYRVNDTLHLDDGIQFGTVDALVREEFIEDGPSAVVGVLLGALGVLSLIVLVRARVRSAAVAWLSAFAAASALLHFWQAVSIRMLLVPSVDFWRACTLAVLSSQIVTFGMLVDALFGLRDRIIRAASVLSVVVLVAWQVSFMADRPQTLIARSILYTVLIAMAVYLAIRVNRLARKGDPFASAFFVGFVGMIVISLPDIVWGWGLRLLPVNTSPFGTLFFTVSVAVILARQFSLQRDALARNVTQVQRLNTELRQQIASRSRELAQVIANPELRPSTELRTGAVLAGRYTLLQHLGEGGMGTVFAAQRKTESGVEDVAVKVMAGSTSPDDAARFTREAEIASQLDHPNLVTVLDVGFADGALYLVMELVRGQSLEDMRERFGDPALMLPLLADVARGLEALHARGVVHRDLKPGNVLVAEQGGRLVAKISDFGISRRADLATSSEVAAVTEQRLTKADAVMGTPLYMAPETMKGAALADERADVFAFGVVAYEMLTCARPFRVAPGLSVVVTGTLPPPPSLASLGLVDPALAELLDRCIAQDPRARPTAAELVAAFAACKAA